MFTVGKERATEKYQREYKENGILSELVML